MSAQFQTGGNILYLKLNVKNQKHRNKLEQILTTYRAFVLIKPIIGILKKDLSMIVL